MEIDKAAIYEHDPWVEEWPEMRAALKAAGFKKCVDDDASDDDEERIVAWFHPDHWICWQLFDPAPPEAKGGPGDTWLYGFSFVAKTERARASLK